MTAQVLIVEDHPEIAFPLVRTLERDGYDVTHVTTGAEALSQVRAGGVDTMILDLGLPDMDGLDVCRQARDGGFDGGILICTARGLELDRVVGLDYGADDYLAKPFSLAELQARVRALLRRTQRNRGSAPDAMPAADAGGLRVDQAAHRIFHGDAELELTGKEYDVLALLADRVDEVVSRETLMSEVWDENWFGSTKTLDVTIGRLRQKLETAAVPVRVANVRGVGFRLEVGAAGRPNDG